MMWHVHPAEQKETEKRGAWGMPVQMESAIALHRMEGVFRC